MNRYWVIAPYYSKDTQIFDKVWKYDIENGTIAIGWGELGDISQMTKHEIEVQYKATYKNVANNAAAKDINSLWAFYHEISPGDIIIARRGTKKVIGLGTVTGASFYDEQKGRQRVANLTDNYHPNFLQVKWEEKELSFENIVFSFYAMTEIDSERYKELVIDFERKFSSDDTGMTGLAIESSLESDLENLIVTNFDGIFKGQLKLYVDPEGNLGKQYTIWGEKDRPIGRIDIVAVETSTNDFVVIELKKGAESDRVIGQILWYMGWVKQNLCQTGADVKGLIICKEIDERLTYALKLVNDKVKIKLYQLDIRLTDP